MQRFRNPAVAEKFRSYPPPVKRKLLALRALIFQIAESTKGVGELTETLKWGEPAYVTEEVESLTYCIAVSLTYHSAKKTGLRRHQ